MAVKKLESKYNEYSELSSSSSKAKRFLEEIGTVPGEEYILIKNLSYQNSPYGSPVVAIGSSLSDESKFAVSVHIYKGAWKVEEADSLQDAMKLADKMGRECTAHLRGQKKNEGSGKRAQINESKSFKVGDKVRWLDGGSVGDYGVVSRVRNSEYGDSYDVKWDDDGSVSRELDSSNLVPDTYEDDFGFNMDDSDEEEEFALSESIRRSRKKMAVELMKEASGLRKSPIHYDGDKTWFRVRAHIWNLDDVDKEGYNTTMFTNVGYFGGYRVVDFEYTPDGDFAVLEPVRD